MEGVGSSVDGIARYQKKVKSLEATCKGSMTSCSEQKEGFTKGKMRKE